MTFPTSGFNVSSMGGVRFDISFDDGSISVELNAFNVSVAETVAAYLEAALSAMETAYETGESLPMTVTRTYTGSISDIL